jgi:membrane associated rhomboid family serine protease
MVNDPSYGRPTVRFGSGWTPVVKWFVIACVGGFVLPGIWRGAEAYLALTPALVWTRGWVWQLATYNFLHASLGHIFFNLLTMYMFAPELERVYGRDRFLVFLAVSGIGAGVCVVLTGPLSTVPTIGCSGIVFAVMLVYAVLYPNRQVLLFFAIPVKIKWLMLGMGALELYYFVGQGNPGVSHIAHLGGMLFGYLYLRSNKSFLGLRDAYYRRKLKRLRKKYKVLDGGKGSGGRPPYVH